MKLLIALAVILSANIQAVVMKDCPEQVTMTISKFNLHNIVDEDAFDDDSRFPFDGWNGPGILRLQKKLRDLGNLTLEYKLFSTHSSKCNYRGINQNGDFTSAVLYGSTRANAKQPATLKAYFGSLVVYAGVKEVARTGLTARGNFASLYYNGEQCSWGDCIPDHIEVGAGPYKLK